MEDLIQPEDKSKDSVSLQMYKDYISMSGGWLFALIIFISMAAWLGLSTRANI